MNSKTLPGIIILINGASSAGKSTLARAVQAQFPLPLLHISFDLFIDGRIPPHKPNSGRCISVARNAAYCV